MLSLSIPIVLPWVAIPAEEIIENSPPFGFPLLYLAPRELKSKPLTDEEPPS